MIQFDASLYYPTFIYSLLALTLMYYLIIANKGSELIEENTNNPLVLVYVVAFIILVGWRPPSGRFFGDSSNYAMMYDNYVIGINIFDPDSKEWFFNWLMYKSSKVMSRADFFLLIEVLYILPAFWACRKLVPNHACLMFVFYMGAFSFFSYGVNGIRNGMACSFIIAALGLVNGNIKDKVIAAVFGILAFYTHRSTALPILCVVASFFVKDLKYAMGLWIASIFISLVAGSTVESFFTGLGFDDRMTVYSSKNADPAMFSSVGFRWDFLLYSSMPILLGYYVVIKQEVSDKNYLTLLTTYILCNSFWVMMIRAAYSNRFAYLSWFLYPIVLAYPLFKLPIWEDDQGKKAGLILLAHLGFTMFMSL